MNFKTAIFMVMVMMITAVASALEVPHSARSTSAVTRAKSRLAPQLSAKNMKLGQNVFIRIFKQEEEFELWLENDTGFGLFKTWPVKEFSGRPGPKTKQGDNQAPEGFYYVTPNRMNPWSSYHLSFNLGYPNSYDRSHSYTGSFLMVHGDSVSIGCYAMTDPVIEEIWTLMDAAFKQDQPFVRVHVFPFRMTQVNMGQYGGGNWHEFWVNLKEGYDFFENGKTVPNVTVRNKRYVFE